MKTDKRQPIQPGLPDASVALLEVYEPTINPASEVRLVALNLVMGTVVYSVANFGIKALGFLLLPIYTHFLTPADYGTVSLAETVASLVGVICGLGLENALRRFYFQYVDDPSELAKYVSTLLRLGAAVAFAVVLIVLLIGPYAFDKIAPHFSIPFFPYVGVAVLTAALTQLLTYSQVLFQVQERPFAYAFFTSSIFFFTAVSVLALVAIAHYGAVGMLLGRLAGAAIMTVAAALIWRKWIRQGWEPRLLRETLHFSLPLVPYFFLGFGLLIVDRLILQHYRNVTEVGLYSLAYTLGMVMYLVTLSVWQAWSPIFFEMGRQGDKVTIVQLSFGVIALLVSVAIFGSLIAQDLVVAVLDPRYAAAGRLIPIIIAAYFMHAMFSLFQLSVLQAKKTKWSLLVIAIAFVSNVVLNLLLIPHWGMYGAAYATLAAYAAEALLMYLCAQHEYHLQYELVRIAALIGLVGVVVAFTQVTSGALHRPFLMLAGFCVAAPLIWFASGSKLFDFVSRLLKTERWRSRIA